MAAQRGSAERELESIKIHVLTGKLKNKIVHNRDH